MDTLIFSLGHQTCNLEFMVLPDIPRILNNLMRDDAGQALVSM